MAKLLKMPKLSPTMEEGQITIWHKKEGDSVDVDDLLAEVETDKATMEFRSFDRGTLLKVLQSDGSVVQLGEAVGILGAPGEDISALVAEAQSRGSSKAEPSAPAGSSSDADGASAAASPAPVATVASGGQLGAGESSRIKASPYVRKLGRERGLDLAGVAGSGPGGRIIARDLEGLASGGRESGGSTAGRAIAVRGPEVRPLSMMRKTIARRLTESKQNVPHFYLSIDVDAGALVALRAQLVADLAAGFTPSAPGDRPPKVSYNDLLIKACALALREVPECNAQFAGDSIVLHGRVDISVAVAVDDGLVTPVVRNADQKSVLSIASEVRELAGRARKKQLTVGEMQDGTFSISNLGMFGIDDFAAVINPPEGAILAVGQTRAEPVVRDGQVVAGHRLGMTLSCDHRVIDGAVGAAFLRSLRRLLEHPSKILVA